MPQKALQILEELHKRFPDMLFAWLDNLWHFGDTTPCTLRISFRENPNKKMDIEFEQGIADMTIDSLAEEGIKHNAIPILKQ